MKTLFDHANEFLLTVPKIKPEPVFLNQKQIAIKFLLQPIYQGKICYTNPSNPKAILYRVYVFENLSELRRYKQTCKRSKNISQIIFLCPRKYSEFLSWFFYLKYLTIPKTEPPQSYASARTSDGIKTVHMKYKYRTPSQT